MAEVAQYIEYVEQKLIPSGLQSLRQCHNVEEVGLWKKKFCRDIYLLQVKGEALEDRIPVENPQEESKKEYNMPQRVFIEAKKLEDDRRLADRQLEKEKESIQDQQLVLEQTLENLQFIPEYSDLLKLNQVKFGEIIAVRVQNLVQNQKLAAELEIKVVTAFQDARLNYKKFLDLPILHQLKQLQVQPKIFKFRDGLHVHDNKIQHPNFEFPKQEELQYDNYIVGFVQKQANTQTGMNVIMSNGVKSNLPLNTDRARGEPWFEVKIQPGAIVKKVAVSSEGGQSDLSFIEFFDKDGNSILQAGKQLGCKKIEFELADGERLVGVKSQVRGGVYSSDSPRHLDFHFIIGWIE